MWHFLTSVFDTMLGNWLIVFPVQVQNTSECYTPLSLQPQGAVMSTLQFDNSTLKEDSWPTDGLEERSQCGSPFYLHSMATPPDGDSCGCEKTSGPIEVYGKTGFWLDLCRHFPDIFMGTVIMVRCRIICCKKLRARLHLESDLCVFVTSVFLQPRQ